MVNVLIGVKTNEWVQIFRSQDARISDLEAQMNAQQRALVTSTDERMQSLEEENRMLREELSVIRTALGLPARENAPKNASFVEQR